MVDARRQRHARAVRLRALHLGFARTGAARAHRRRLRSSACAAKPRSATASIRPTRRIAKRRPPTWSGNSRCAANFAGTWASPNSRAPNTRPTTSSAPWPRARAPRGCATCVVTRDKDLSQLIRDGDVFWDYSGNARYHYHDIGAAVRRDPGTDRRFSRAHRRSWTTFPACPGIGKKTAAELFAIFGSLDELYANLRSRAGAEAARRRGRRRAAARAQGGGLSGAAA